ncbi:probable multidrug resistance-associated protein lethal(2)03659 isoform X1 [Diorhabda carinulata]|uniref:probable multidrug resistance-associated protein lethal(2)03659 isoform X1 n=2 Tax=Diorhabda carinulata TaxID=1163345 RepID=UPI0025A0C495|nr:probable multidrug resistance-associated protein lethal(2)03659 isoform X1 [Diorhabda carinulata]
MDHSEKVNRPPHPRDTANIFSLLSFAYLANLFTKGFKKDLEDDDLYEVVEKVRSKKCGNKLEHAYLSRAKSKSSVSFYRLLWQMYGLQYVGLGIIQLAVKLFISVLEPNAVANLIQYFTPGQMKMTIYDALFYAGIMIGVKAFHCIFFQNYHVFLLELMIKMKVSITSLIYRKTLKLSPKAMEKASLGNIITIITKDVHQIDAAIITLNEIWISMIQTVVMCYLIYRRIGISSLVGISMLILIIPFQAYVSKLIRRFRLKMLKRTDDRLQKTQESLSTIKTIKMYTWEDIFSQKIGEVRFKELRTLLKAAYLRVSLIISSSLISKFAFYAMIMTYIYLYQNMTASDVFYIMRIFGTLRFTVSLSFSLGFTRLGELRASLQRLKNVLEFEELPDFIDKRDDDPQIDFRSATVILHNKEILKDINLKLSKGLNIITGQLGCGKSSLIKAALRDYPVEDGGEVRVRGRMSYASQDPWLFPSSIKQNILFGEKYNEERYRQVISACALAYDFEILEKGDETIVADRGMNLSKGQQARVNLARAVYQDSDIYLIDDALTALDTRVQEHIFTNCIQGLLQDKCIVLVTHNSHHIKLADNIVILKDGKVVSQTDQTNIARELMEAFETVDSHTKENIDMKSGSKEDPVDEKSKLLKGPKPQLRRRQVYHEVKKSGKVDFGLYIEYVKMGGGIFIGILLLLTFAGSTFVDSASQKILTNWINIRANITSSRENFTREVTYYNRTHPSTIDNPVNLTNVTSHMNTLYNTERQEMRASKTLHIYTILIITFAAVELLKNYCILKLGFSAAVKIHNRMINRVVNATMAFFDNFFIGNILNRFSQDLSIVDEHIAVILSHIISSVFHLVGAIGLIATVNWKFVVPAIALAIFSVVFRNIYIRSARSLKRLEAATRSPMVGHLNSTMEGLTTIRAYKAQDILKGEFDKHQDLYISALFTSICVRAAFSFVMEISSTIFTATVIMRFLFFEQGTVAGDVGLTITQTGMLSNIVNMALQSWSELENTMTSVERAMEYTTVDVESKTGLEVDNWPSKGEIKYKNVSLKYTNSEENVLKNISFDVEAKSRIGIVGRTGAGKSSIISTLYRLYNYDGEILIDGVELKTLSLKFLRQHISIIPQDPIMFSGTVRSNVDPLDEYTDEEIWKTLHKVQLDSVVPNLRTEVGDINFSTGQRQLICVARAIIRKNKILVLDEATANMDPETELIAQKIINDNFSNCTLLIIAHRLDSVLECEKVMVLDRGQIMEFDNPKNLLKNKTSLFAEMMRNAGMDHLTENPSS